MWLLDYWLGARRKGIQFQAMTRNIFIVHCVQTGCPAWTTSCPVDAEGRSQGIKWPELESDLQLST